MSKSKNDGFGFLSGLKYVTSSALNAKNAKGSLSGSALNLFSMGSFGDKENQSGGGDKDIVAGFFDFLIDIMPNGRDPGDILEEIAKPISDHITKDKEMEERWNKALDEYKKDGTYKDLAQKLAEELDKETAKEKEPGTEKTQEQTQEKTFTLTPGKDGKNEEKDSAGDPEVKSDLQNLVDGAIADFKKPAPEGLTLVKIELKMRVPGGFEAGGKSQQVKVTKTPYYVDKEGKEVVGQSEDIEITLNPGDIENAFGGHEQERESSKEVENDGQEDKFSSIKENLKDLKLESVKPGEKPHSGAGMSEEKKKEQEIESPS